MLFSTASTQFPSPSISLEAVRTASTLKLQVAVQAIAAHGTSRITRSATPGIYTGTAAQWYSTGAWRSIVVPIRYTVSVPKGGAPNGDHAPNDFRVVGIFRSQIPGQMVGGVWARDCKIKMDGPTHSPEREKRRLVSHAVLSKKAAPQMAAGMGHFKLTGSRPKRKNDSPTKRQEATCSKSYSGSRPLVRVWDSD